MRDLEKTAISFVGLAALVAFLSTGGFSKEVAFRIKRRAGYRSEWSGVKNMPLEASHIDHTKNKWYNSPENGECITVLEHLAYHTFYKNKPHQIGLDKGSNDHAIRSLRERVGDYLKSSGADFSEQYLDTLVNETIHEHLQDPYSDYAQEA